MEFENPHIQHMQRCIELASFAQANGKSPVGSVIVKNNEIIAEGIEGDSEYPGLIAHSEIIALIKAVEKLGTYDLSDCTLYTTVEPCFMCSYATRRTRISQVVYAKSAGEIGGATSEYPFLTSDDIEQWGKSPEILPGFMEEEYLEMIDDKSFTRKQK